MSRNSLKVIKIIIVVIAMVVCYVAFNRLGNIYPTYMGHIISLRHWPMTLTVTTVVMFAISKLLRRSIYIDKIIKILAGIFTISFVAVLIHDAFWGIVRICDTLAGINDGVFVFLVLGSIMVILVYAGYCLIGQKAADID